MAPKYKLSYFTIKGLAEPIRFLLAYIGDDFEDKRYSLQEWKDNGKTTSPWGKLPILEVEGQAPVTQSMPITRYLGREAGLSGANSWEDLRIDEIVSVIDELRSGMANYYYNPDEKVKETLKEPLFNETMPYYLTKLDAHVASNNGYLANGKLSWADLYFAAILGTMYYMLKVDVTDGYPNLKALKEKVLALPKIKKYVDKRPEDIPIVFK